MSKEYIGAFAFLMANPSAVADLRKELSKKQNAKPKKPMNASTRAKLEARRAAAKAERKRIIELNGQHQEASYVNGPDDMIYVINGEIVEHEQYVKLIIDREAAEIREAQGKVGVTR